MNEEFIQKFYQTVCRFFQIEDKAGHRNTVHFSTVLEDGNYYICLEREDEISTIFYEASHLILMRDFGLLETPIREINGECFTLEQLKDGLQQMKALDPTVVALDDVVPDFVKWIAVIAESEEASATQEFFSIAKECFEVVLSWKKAIADRYFGGLLMADAALIDTFFALAKEYANKEN